MESNELNVYLFHRWRQGVFRDCSDSTIGPSKRFDCRLLIDRRLLSRMYGAEQILWFDGDESGLEFKVFTKTDINDVAGQIRDAIDVRTRELTLKKRGVYGELFGEVYTGQIGLGYEGANNAGVITTAAVKDIPAGKGGGMSGRIVDYAYNMFALPAMTVVWGVPISGRTWHVLDRPQNIDPRRR